MGVFYAITSGISIIASFITAVGYPAFVDGVSMRPVLNPNEGDSDCVFLNRWTVRDFNIQKGNIVCLKNPRNPRSSILIKRVVALEGDVVRTLGYRSTFVKIPIGHCWVEGENHSQSMDSNFFGPVPLGLIQAKVSHIIWPPSRISKLPTEVLPGREVF